MNEKKLAQLIQFIETADVSLQQAREILKELGGEKAGDILAKNKARNLVSLNNENNQIIEGVFNGQNMIGPDGKEFSVPANYSSKSKLVEGDILKLTIQNNGGFVYKQIKPVERNRVKGKLIIDEVTGKYSVLAEDQKKYNVLTASVTYFKAQPNDDLIIIIPKNKICQWAAIENVIQKNDFKENTETLEPVVQEKNFKDEPVRRSPTLPAGELDKGGENKISDLADKFDLEKSIQGEVEEVKNKNKENSELKKSEPYQGFSSYAEHDSILPEVDELKINNSELEEEKEKHLEKDLSDL